MKQFTFSRAFFLGVATLVASQCKTTANKELIPSSSGDQSSETLSVEAAGPAEATEVESLELAASAAGTNSEGPLSAPRASDLLPSAAESPAQAQAPSSAATASIVLEKRDRFGNLYRLDSLGNLYRYFGGTLKCQVTNQVMDFKMNMHPADEGVAYLVRNEGLSNGVLYALMDSPQYGLSQCPKSFKVRALGGLTGYVNDKYKIVSNLNDYQLGTSATMLAINGSGELVGWRGRSRVFQNSATVRYSDLVMNTCYGSRGKSYSSYVAFTLEKGSGLYHRVAKIKGRNTVQESKFDTRTWRSIQDFKAYYGVCNTGVDSYPPPPPPPSIYTKDIDCSSTNAYGFNVCDPKIGTGYVNKVQIINRYSTAACTAGTSYGNDSRSIWVSIGCRLKIRVTYQPSYY